MKKAALSNQPSLSKCLLMKTDDLDMFERVMIGDEMWVDSYDIYTNTH